MLVVHKYGGTSVGDVERIENVTNRVAKAREDGDDIVVVVSAMSGETNKLIGYAEHFTKEPAKKRDGYAFEFWRESDCSTACHLSTIQRL